MSKKTERKLNKLKKTVKHLKKPKKNNLDKLNTMSVKKLNNIKKILSNFDISDDEKEKIAYHTLLYYPDFNPDKWNSDEQITKTHNCYAYFLNTIDKNLAKLCKETNERNCNGFKPQPGLAAGLKEIDDKSKYTCKTMNERIIADNPGIYIGRRDKPCKKGHYMGAVAIDPGHTYHFYRKDNNGFWSHKNGQMEAKNFDADGNVIPILQRANRTYSKKIKENTLDYKKICSYFCIPKYTRKRMSHIRIKKNNNNNNNNNNN